MRDTLRSITKEIHEGNYRSITFVLRAFYLLPLSLFINMLKETHEGN